ARPGARRRLRGVGARGELRGHGGRAAFPAPDLALSRPHAERGGARDLAGGNADLRRPRGHSGARPTHASSRQSEDDMSQSPAGARFPSLIDLASSALGGRALSCSDDFFASMHNLVKPEPPVFDPNAYGDNGKIMDGWESRRKR